MNTTKLLSIIIPIYNSEMYLKECLDSILVSKNNKYEIILINDGSTDNSKIICEKYANKDNIFLYNQENSGVSKARNYGMAMSKSKYIMFVDSDDVLKKGWEKIIECLDNDDIYYFSNRIPNSDNKELLLNYIVGNNEQNISFAGPFSKIYKREFLNKNNIIFNDRLINGEDMLFNIKGILCAKHLSVINYSFYKYRNFIGSSTKRFNEEIFKSDLIFQNELSNLLASYSILNKQFVDNTLLFCKQMAIFIFCQRIAFIDRYKNAKRFYYNIFKEPYLDAFKHKKIVDNKYYLFVCLCKYKLFFINYIILNMKNIIKIDKKKTYYFSEI